MQAGKKLGFRELQITLHTHLEDFDFEDFILANPKTSQSGNWEVWKLDREGEYEAKAFEDIEFVPSDRLLEIHSQETLSEGAVYDILCALQIGFGVGEKSGMDRVRRSVKFAMAALTGEIDGEELDQAADAHEYRMRKQTGT